MSNPETHTCPNCGYVWKHGQDGSHSCSTRLQTRVRELEAQLPNPGGKGFSFEAVAKKVPKSADIGIWIDSISLTVELPGKGDRFPHGVPAWKPKVGKSYRITIEEI